MLLTLFVSMAWSGPPITVETLAQHGRPDDCWTAIDGTVYDITDFIAHHPGGQMIVHACGRDSSDLFHSRPTDQQEHSRTAQTLLAGMAVGPLEGRAPEAVLGASNTTDGRPEPRSGVLLPTTGTIPRGELNLSIQHAFGSPQTLGVGTAASLELDAGLTSFMDLGVYSSTWTGDLGATLRVSPWQQYGRRYNRYDSGDPESQRPLSLILEVGGVRRLSEDPSGALIEQVAVSRAFGNDRLILGVSETLAWSPGAGPDVVVGSSLRLRPSRSGALVGEVLWSPSGAPLTWSAGLEGYTKGHIFGFWLANTAALSPMELVRAPLDEEGVQRRGLAFGMRVSRWFHVRG